MSTLQGFEGKERSLIDETACVKLSIFIRTVHEHVIIQIWRLTLNYTLMKSHQMNRTKAAVAKTEEEEGIRSFIESCAHVFTLQYL